MGYSWIRRIGRNWVINCELIPPIMFYAGLLLALAGLFLPSQWHVLPVGFALSLTYPVGAGIARWAFFHGIRCPKCGFNATHGVSTDAPLNYAVAMARLEAYVKCPRCGDEANGA